MQSEIGIETSIQRLRLPPEKSYLSLGEIDLARRYLYTPIKRAAPTTANQLFGYHLAESRGYPELENFVLGDIPIHFFQVERPAIDLREYIGFMGTRLGGEAINRLFFSIASNKAFHLDTNDLLEDWALIDTPNYQEMLARHKKELGIVWEIMERDRSFFRKEIERWHTRGSQPDRPETLHPGITPVIRWAENGHRRWVFDYLEGSPYENLRMRMAQELEPGYLKKEQTRRFNPSVGFWVVVHFSWDRIGSAWPPDIPLNRDRSGVTRENSTSRSGGYAIRRAYQFLNCDFIQRAEEYFPSNLVPFVL